MLYDTAGGVIHILNDAAARVWALCDGTRAQRDIVTELLADFEAPRHVIERDVGTIVARFELLGLLSGAPSSEGVDRQCEETSTGTAPAASMPAGPPER